MLQPYFAFECRYFYLCSTYFALIHRQTTIHYLRFILLLISTFLMVLVSKYCKNHGPSTLKR